MRVTIQTVDKETGEAINTPGPWDEDSFFAVLADVRYEREHMGITIGSQFITTHRHERADWRERYDHAGLVLAGDAKAIRELQPTNGLYPYKPYEGKFGTFLTPQQVRRAFECIRWYVNTCFAVEIMIQQMVTTPDSSIEAIEPLLKNPVFWPARQLSWEE